MISFINSPQPKPGVLPATAAPKVTIGLPVYNSARHLRQAMDSLLEQTFSDFELVVSDNASTDGTWTILQEYAAKDKRVRLIRQETNIGAPRNWNAVLTGARGEYFKWASGNDYCDPALVERCAAALDADPGAVLAYGRTELVDEAGKSLGVYGGDLDVREQSPSERYARVRIGLDLNNLQQGLMRTDVLQRTGKDRLYPGGDLTLTAELSLYGRLLLLPQVLLYRRHSPNAIMALKTPTEVQRIYNPAARRPMKLLRGRMHWDQFLSVARAPIPPREKTRALHHVLRHLRWDRDRLWREMLSLFQSDGQAAGAAAPVGKRAAG